MAASDRQGPSPSGHPLNCQLRSEGAPDSRLLLAPVDRVRGTTRLFGGRVLPSRSGLLRRAGLSLQGGWLESQGPAPLPGHYAAVVRSNEEKPCASANPFSTSSPVRSFWGLCLAVRRLIQPRTPRAAKRPLLRCLHPHLLPRAGWAAGWATKDNQAKSGVAPRGGLPQGRPAPFAFIAQTGAAKAPDFGGLPPQCPRQATKPSRRSPNAATESHFGCRSVERCLAHRSPARQTR
jgi:hypothetical protein